MNAHEVYVMNLSKSAKEHWAALANQQCRGEPYSKQIPQLLAYVCELVNAEAGGIEVMEEALVPKPAVLPRDILVKIKAVSMNPVDVKTRNGAG